MGAGDNRMWKGPSRGGHLALFKMRPHLRPTEWESPGEIPTDTHSKISR